MPAPLKINTVAGTCGHCGEIVKKGEGRIGRKSAQWKAFHLNCSVKHQRTVIRQGVKNGNETQN